jgi:hypothetical protein
MTTNTNARGKAPRRATKPAQPRTLDFVNALIKNGGIFAGDVSDGYHTFNELYDHRIRLYIALCSLLSGDIADGTVWCTRTHSDGSLWPGWFLLGIGSKAGEQITYHLPESHWDEVATFATVLDKAPEFDGHTPADVLERLREQF